MYCIKCGNQIANGSRFCPNCGCPVENAETQSQSQQIDKVNNSTSESYITTHTIPLDSNVQTAQPTQAKKKSSLQKTAKVFLVLSCIGVAVVTLILLLFFLYFKNLMATYLEMTEYLVEYDKVILIYLFIVSLLFCECLFMTIYYFSATKANKPVGLGYKLSVLFFVNIIAGILMLNDKDQE